MNVQRYSVFFGLLLILSTVSVLCFGEVVEKSFSYQDFDKLTRVCTETDNWCRWANRPGKAIIYGEMSKKIDVPSPAVNKVEVTISIPCNAWGEGLAGPADSSAHIIVDDVVEEDKIDNTMPYHHGRYYKYEFCQQFTHAFDIKGKEAIALTIRMNNEASLDFQKATLTFHIDTTKPVISLLGENSVTLGVGSQYIEAGATASDDQDGNITNKVVISGNVDTNQTGAYRIAYNVSDAAGNPAIERIRRVYVVDLSIESKTRAFEHLEEIMDKFHQTFDVYTDFIAGGNHGAPGGWMGTPVGIDILKVEPRWNSNCYNGLTCFKNIWETTSTIDWVGIYWLEPDGNWGQIPNAGFDLTGATQVTFYARGEEGGEPVEFFAGGVTGDYPDSIQPKASTGRISLTKAWKKYTIDLSGKDLTHVISPFGWTVAIDPIFYIDDVQYDLPRPNALRFLQSYEILDIDKEIAIANAAHVYDNALALLAFLARGTEDDLRRAKILADALVFVLNNDRHYKDGRLRNVYMSGDLAESVTGTAKLSGWWDTGKQAWFEDEYSVSTHTGNLAWAMLALLGYYEKMGGEKYLEAVKTMGEWLERETKDERGAGGYTGGYKGWEQTDKNPTPPQKLLYKATEHNIDLYPVFMRLYRITKETKWLESAKHAKNFVEAMWNAQEGHFWTGSTENGVDINQDNIPVDVQAWAIMAMPAENRYRAGLQWAEQNCYFSMFKLAN